VELVPLTPRNGRSTYISNRSSLRQSGHTNPKVILARGLAKVGIEGVIADRQGEVVRAGVFVLLLPDGTALDQFAATGAAKDTVPRCQGVAACDGFHRDVEVECQVVNWRPTQSRC